MSWKCEEHPFLPDSLSSHKKKQTNKQIKQKKEEDADMP